MTQYSAKSGAITLNAVAVAHLKSMNVQYSQSVIEEHDLDGGEADLLEGDQITYRITAQKAYVSSETTSALLTGGTSFTVLYYPRGTGAGMELRTFSTCIMTSYRMGNNRGQVVLEDVEIAAKTVASSTI